MPLLMVMQENPLHGLIGAVTWCHEYVLATWVVGSEGSVVPSERRIHGSGFDNDSAFIFPSGPCSFIVYTWGP